MAQNPSLPRTSLTLDEARTRLSGLHFAKEALSEHEREILYIAEGLLRLIDAEDSLSEEQCRIRSLALKSGVNEVSVYNDGVEVTGSPGDSDEQVGFVTGDFAMEQVRAAVGDNIPVVNRRS